MVNLVAERSLAMGEDKNAEDHLQEALATIETDRAPGWLEGAYRQHGEAVVRTAYRVTGSVDDAEDVLQTVFVRLANRQDPPDLSRGALPYLRRAATNAALDVVQSRYARTTFAFEGSPQKATSDTAPSQERLQQSREVAQELRVALARLNRRQAEIFILKYFEDMDHRSIAELLGTTPGTVAVTLHRVRSRLAADLKPLIGGNDD